MAREKICCIYRITSKVHPDRIYIGSTTDFGNRKRLHLYHLRTGAHHNCKLQCHANKYGIDDFVFDIIELIQFESKEQVLGREQYYLDSLHPYLNISTLAESCYGVKRSEETKQKVGKASKGHKMPQHVLDLLVSINTGSHISEEHKKSISIAQSNPKPYMAERNKGNTYGKANKGKVSPFKGEKGKKTGVVPHSAFKKGSIPWNKGKKVRYIAKPSQSVSMKKYWADRHKKEKIHEQKEEAGRRSS